MGIRGQRFGYTDRLLTKLGRIGISGSLRARGRGVHLIYI